MRIDKPAKLAFSDEASFTLARGIILMPSIIIIPTFILAFVTTDATLGDLALPCAVISVGWFEWITRDYSALGYSVVRVPVLGPEEWLAFVLERLSEQGLI